MIATLANLIRYDFGLRVFCNSCHKCRELEVNALAAKYGTSMELPEIGKRARCGDCGTKGGSVQVVAGRW